MEKLLAGFSRIGIRIMEVIMVFTMFWMLVLVGTNVFLRIFANTGIDFAEEVPRFMFVWLVFCGAVVASKERTHISVNLFVLMASRPLQKIFYFITESLVMITGILLTYGTIELHTIVYENSSPVLQISTLWVYGVTYLAGPGLTLIGLCNLIRLFAGTVPDSELKGRDEAMEEALASAERESEGAKA